jgi:hypothetical protein
VSRPADHAKTAPGKAARSGQSEKLAAATLIDLDIERGFLSFWS